MPKPFKYSLTNFHRLNHGDGADKMHDCLVCCRLKYLCLAMNTFNRLALTCDQAFFFFVAEGGRKKKESLIQLLVESSAAPQLKCLSTRVSAMPSDKSEPITIYQKSLRWRESAEARSGHEVCKHLCKLPFVSRPIRKKSRFWTFYRRLDK